MAPCAQCLEPTHNPKFCTRSCAVAYNNHKSPKRKSARSSACRYCGGPKTKKSKHYCSQACNHAYRWLHDIEKIEHDGQPSDRVAKRYLMWKFGERCAVAGCPITAIWLGKPLVLTLDHIDGDGHNNKISNLRLLCPNCHSQTSTYKGRNKGKGRVARREQALRDYYRIKNMPMKPSE